MTVAADRSLVSVVPALLAAERRAVPREVGGGRVGDAGRRRDAGVVDGDAGGHADEVVDTAAGAVGQRPDASAARRDEAVAWASAAAVPGDPVTASALPASAAAAATDNSRRGMRFKATPEGDGSESLEPMPEPGSLQRW